MAKKLMVVAIMALSLTGCTNSGAKLTLEQQGYKNVKLTGYRIMACSDDDAFHTGFQAVTSAGATVTGTVCEGWFKGKTIRLD